jgi:hypothetical protein
MCRVDGEEWRWAECFLRRVRAELLRFAVELDRVLLGLLSQQCDSKNTPHANQFAAIAQWTSRRGESE